MEKKVSIIIPVYQNVSSLILCIDSVLKQNYSNKELILIDDGSTDGSGILCDQLRKEHKNIIVIHQANSGVSVSRNAGLRVASGSYIYFADADDYLKPNCISSLVKCMNNHDLAICDYETSSFSSEKGKSSVKFEEIRRIKLGRKKTYRLVIDYGEEKKENKISGYLWNKLFSLRIIKQSNLIFDERSTMWEDLLFCCEYISHIKSAEYLHKELYFYNTTNDKSIVHNLDLEKIDNWIKSGLKIYELLLKNADYATAKFFEGKIANICVEYLILSIRLRKKNSQIFFHYYAIARKNFKFLRKKYKLEFVFILFIPLNVINFLRFKKNR